MQCTSMNAKHLTYLEILNIGTWTPCSFICPLNIGIKCLILGIVRHLTEVYNIIVFACL